MLEKDSTWHLFFSEGCIGGVEKSDWDSELEKCIYIYTYLYLLSYYNTTYFIHFRGQLLCLCPIYTQNPHSVDSESHRTLKRIGKSILLLHKITYSSHTIYHLIFQMCLRGKRRWKHHMKKCNMPTEGRRNV